MAANLGAQEPDTVVGDPVVAAREAWANDEFEEADRQFLVAYEGSAETLAGTVEHAALAEEYSEFLTDYGEYVRARRLLVEAVAVRETIPSPPERIADTLIVLAGLDRENGEYDEARDSYQSAVLYLEQADDADGEAIRDARLQLVNVQFLREDREAAGEVTAQILEQAEAEYGRREDLADVYDLVANHHYNAYWDDKLTELRMEALSIREESRGTGTVGHAEALRATAEELYTDHWSTEADGHELAAGLYRHALTIYDELGYSVTAELAATQSSLGDVLYSLDQLADSEAAYGAAIELRSEAGAIGVDQARDHCAVGTVRLEDLRVRDAIPAFKTCLEIRRSVFEEGSSAVESALENLVEAYAEAGDRERAIDLLRERVDFYDSQDEGETLFVAGLLIQIGDYATELERYAEAAEAYERAVAIHETEYADDELLLIPLLSKLQQAYASAGEDEKSQATATRIAAIAVDDTFGDYLGIFSEDIPGTEVPWYLVGLLGMSFFGLVVVVGGIAFSLRLVDKADEKEALAGLAPVASGGGPEPGTAIAVAEEAPAGATPEAVATAAVAVEPPRARDYSLRFHGQGRALFGIWIVNVLLTFVTLGIYYFWGKVRIRRYIWANSELWGDRFAFHGTPFELFIGWLKASPLLGFILWGPNIVLFLTSDVSYSTYAQLAGVALLLFFWPIAEIGSFRYRLTRSSYRGLRFSFHGKTWRYLALYLLNWPAWLFTAGLWTPYFNSLKRRYLLNHTRFGDSPLACTASGSDLLGPYVLNWFLAVPTLGVYRYWYLAQREQYYWSQTTYRGVRFRCTIKGSDLFTMTVLGGLATIFSLGFASPWVECWKNRIWLDSISMEGQFDPDWIRQDLGSGDATGDSMADFLGVDLGFFAS